MMRDVVAVPDPEKLDSVQKLCLRSDPYHFGPNEERLFVQAMRENVSWHSERVPFYRRLLKSKNFHPDQIQSLEDCSHIPFILASFFKAHVVISVPESEIAAHLTSSGTSGQKSQTFFDHWSLSAGQGMVDKIFNHYGWITPEQKTNYLLYTYETEADSQLGTAFTDNYLCGYAPVQNAFYALRRRGTGGHDFDVFGCIEKLQRYAEQGLPVRIFGFPSFLHFTLKRMRDLKLPKLQLSDQSLVFLGGGWKGHADQMISKSQLYADIANELGIPDSRIRDGFGAVEHGVPYIECDHHQFHVPIWSQVYIRDTRTLEILGYGKPGLLHFITPYITSTPGQSVLMGDMATLHSGETCPCKVSTPYFVIHGRAGTSKNRSCGIAAAELLRNA
jgi:phenylacetate-coenzyme A ligase PaaK-like adenylate-forming protein